MLFPKVCLFASLRTKTLPRHYRVRWELQGVEDDIRRLLSVPNTSTFMGNDSEELL